MKTFIFYTTEGYCESPNEESIENMQVLGEASGKNYKEALDNLIKENTWIIDNGFIKDKIIGKQLLDDELRENIKVVLEYLWLDEKKHYEEDKCKDHIYLFLRNLKKSI